MKLFGIIFSSVGTILLSVSAFLFIQEKQFIERAKITSGTVIEMGRSVSSSSDNRGSVTYYPVVEFFTAGGKRIVFSSNFSSNPPAYEVGEKVEVYYEPEKPSGAEIKSFFSQWFAAILTGGMGLIFGTIGFVNLGIQFKKKRNNEWLQLNGKRIDTKIQSVGRDTFTKINGRSPFIIYSQWLNPQTREIHVFKSDSIMYDPREFLKGDSVPVWIDVNNYKKYQMDLSFLPKVNE
jgi:hypothetical protein